MKPEEKFFIDELNKMFIAKDILSPGNFIFKNKENIVLLYYDKFYETLLINYSFIWYILQHKYKMEYEVTQEFIRDMLYKHLKWKIQSEYIGPHSVLVHEHLKWEEGTIDLESAETFDVSALPTINFNKILTWYKKIHWLIGS